MPGKTGRQRRAAGAALAAKRRGSPEGLYGAALDMYRSMSAIQLEEFATKPKPKRKHR